MKPTTPPGATIVDPLTEIDGKPVRFFSSTMRSIGPVEITVAGTQTPAGVERTARINDQPVTGEQIDQLIATLTAVREWTDRQSSEATAPHRRGRFL